MKPISKDHMHLLIYTISQKPVSPQIGINPLGQNKQNHHNPHSNYKQQYGLSRHDKKKVLIIQFTILQNTPEANIVTVYFPFHQSHCIKFNSRLCFNSFQNSRPILLARNSWRLKFKMKIPCIYHGRNVNRDTLQH